MTRESTTQPPAPVVERQYSRISDVTARLAFTKKLQIVKENYFPDKAAVKETNLISEEFDDGLGEPEAPKSDDPLINRYADAISRGIHKLPTRS